MKLILSFLLISIAAMAFMRISKPVVLSPDEARLNVIRYKQKFNISCSPDLSTFNPDDSSDVIPLLDG